MQSQDRRSSSADTNDFLHPLRHFDPKQKSVCDVHHITSDNNHWGVCQDVVYVVNHVGRRRVTHVVHTEAAGKRPRCWRHILGTLSTSCLQLAGGVCGVWGGGRGAGGEVDSSLTHTNTDVVFMVNLCRQNSESHLVWNMWRNVCKWQNKSNSGYCPNMEICQCSHWGFYNHWWRSSLMSWDQAETCFLLFSFLTIWETKVKKGVDVN